MNEMMLRQVGLFVGILLRLLLPAAYVWYNTVDFKWNHKYTKQAVFAIIMAFAGVVLGYTDPVENLTPYQTFWFSVKDGVLLEEVVNQVRKLDDLRLSRIVMERNNDD